MNITLDQLPSRGYRADLPNELTVNQFGGAALNFLGKAFETNDMVHVLHALGTVCEFDIGQLTIPDAMYLAYLQRLALKDVSALRVTARCRHPVFTQADGSTLYALKARTGPVVNTKPCDTIIYADLSEKESLLITLPSDEQISMYEGTTFSLPRVHQVFELGTCTLSSVDWVAMHLDMSATDAKTHLSSQPDLSLWMQLSNWATFSVHGLATVAHAHCPVCKRNTDVTWHMVPQMFLL